MSVQITTTNQILKPLNQTTRGFTPNFIEINNIEKILTTNLPPNLKIGFICNTVKNTQKLYEHLSTLYPTANITLSHSNFLTVDRLHNDSVLLNLLGKNCPPITIPLIVVGTQVLEQSLDIDFDVLFTELAPIDSIFQRAGRLHRHTKTRAKRFQSPQLYLIHDDSQTVLNSKGSSIIYGDYRLEQAKAVLKIRENQFVSYKDISNILEEAYSFENSEILPLKNKWISMEQNYADKSKTFMLNSPSAKRDKPIYDWLDGDSTLDSDLAGQSQVRNGQSGPTIVALFRDSNGIFVPFYEGAKQIRSKIYITINDELMFKEVKAIMGASITLPIQFTTKIEALEQAADMDIVNTWKRNLILKGEIPILFDFSNRYRIQEYILCYSRKSGLIVRKAKI